MDKLFAVLIVISGIFFVSFIAAYPVMLLWNGCLVPAVPFVREVTWLQMWGLEILFTVLFKDNNLFSSKKQ